jgi:hypothetical protein
MRMIRRFRMLHRCQQGFTTVTLMGTLMVGGLLVAASFAAVDPDISLTAKDENSKQAYAAAEAGINYYVNRLGQDNGYYLKCTNVPAPAGAGTSPVNQKWTTGTTDPRTFYNIQGYSAKFAIELLPATGYTACQENVQQSMVDQSSGSFRIRATGVSAGAKRSIIAQLRRKTFIDFIYFTDFETLPPATYSSQSDRDWAALNCQNYRGLRHSNCENITFPGFDDILGPLHTNDSILVCGSPQFGRNANDMIELNQVSPGYFTSPSCGSSSPSWAGTREYPAGILPMPSSNAELAAAADYTYTGETTIVFSGSTMSITNGGSTSSQPLPPDGGVVYVKNSSCTSGGYQRRNTLPEPLPANNPGGSSVAGCGNVYIRGTYNHDITIGAENDIIVTDDFLASPQTGVPKLSVLAGLVANNFVRVYHPVDFDGSDCDNDNGPGNIQIDAAILAVNQSFITDNWYCGSPLGTLTVNGAIAQRFRGTVGTFSGSSPASGYSKNYRYNDNLRFREPPHFINPTESAWQIIRQNEQVPAR